MPAVRPNVRTALGAAAVLSALVLGTSGCGALFGDEPAPLPAQATTPPPASAVKDIDKINTALEPLAKKHPEPTSKQLFQALTAAGYQPDQLEASIDASPLDHPVSAKMFGVRTSKGCIVGEIRKGKLSTFSAAALKSTDTCLIGKVMRPSGAGDDSSK